MPDKVVMQHKSACMKRIIQPEAELSTIINTYTVNILIVNL